MNYPKDGPTVAETKGSPAGHERSFLPQQTSSHLQSNHPSLPYQGQLIGESKDPMSGGLYPMANEVEIDIDSPAYLQHMQGLLSRFWDEQMQEMEALQIGTEQDFKNHNDLPLMRIKRIMKSDEDVRMIAAEAPILFAKATEMFILEITLRSW
eukprot:CAMPEP_0117756076 /NCGR_PEP_ID=MMETSP0947-20121206/13837_1 /TAXON_ID=44440 /ORGANISM="Chattonella subsalsa, Strain CCMP2191" /LENGTH=152 /DNA_ID=CAMNT_0005575543 /DNA_START=287 /DNA_END=742 /DNA_ORIENTATION=+